MSESKAELIDNLRGLRRHMGLAVEMAKLSAPTNAKLELAVTLTNPDGSGNICGRFDAGEFLTDFEQLLDMAALVSTPEPASLAERVRAIVLRMRKLSEDGVTQIWADELDALLGGEHGT